MVPESSSRSIPPKVIEQLRQPILIIQGERDTQVPPHHADTLAELARARKKVPADSVRLVKLPGVNHLLVPADMGNVTESASLAGRSVTPEVGSAAASFLKEKVGKKG